MLCLIHDPPLTRLACKYVGRRIGMSSGWADLSRDGRQGTPITGIGELITNDRDDGTYATLNNAALVISWDRVTWAGPASRASAADRVGWTDGSDQHP